MMSYIIFLIYSPYSVNNRVYDYIFYRPLVKHGMLVLIVSLPMVVSRLTLCKFNYKSFN